MPKWPALKIGGLNTSYKLGRGLELRYWPHTHTYMQTRTSAQTREESLPHHQVTEDIMSLAKRKEQTLCILCSAPNTEIGRAENRSLSVSPAQALGGRAS